MNSRLVRVGFVVVAPAVLAFLFSISTTGSLPRSSLDPLFEAESAAALANTLTTEYPARVPGSEGADGAARWYRETIAGVGLPTEEDVWVEDLADLGRVELRNIVTTVPGRSAETIVVVAHRDNGGGSESRGDNPSGTAALLELARGFAPQEIGPDPLPQRTLVLVSTDAGSYGGAGAERFAQESPLARQAVAVVVLDGLAGGGRPRLAVAGDEPVSPARAVVRTAAVRVAEQVGVEPALPSVATQLFDLGIPFARGEQGRFLAHGVAAVAITSAGLGDSAAFVGDPTNPTGTERLGQLGRAAEALVSSLDSSARGSFRTPDSLFLGDRAASGWTVRLMFVLGIVPFALGVADLLVRGRRRGLPFAPALRALRTRLAFWLFCGVLLWLGALTGVFPTGAPLPLPATASLLESPPAIALVLLAAAAFVAWLFGRRRLVPLGSASSEELLAGFATALALLGLVAIVLALIAPYALVFVLPSLYAWLWLPLNRQRWRQILLFAVGLAGPAIGLVSLAGELDISLPEAALYVLGLVTVGYISVPSLLLGLVWATVAAQIGALAFGRYAPYAGGAAHVPRGPIRRAFRRPATRG